MTELPLNNHTKTILEKCKAHTIQLNRNGIDIDMLFYYMITFPSMGLASMADKVSINLDLLQNEMAEVINNKKPCKKINSTPNQKVKKLFKSTEEACGQFNLDYISHELLFLTFFCDDFAPTKLKQLIKSDIITNDDIQTLIHAVAAYERDFDEDEYSEMLGLSFEADSELDSYDFPETLDMFQENEVLSQFSENLNLKAARGNFDKIVDFDGKIDELAAILCRKKKPNAILVGAAGCGKTSIIESLALKIVKGDAPELLANKVIYSVNLSGMVAGTMYRGQFEERLQKFVDEVKKYENIILFIDEIHTLVGAGGGSESSLEASNILKPELARGTISCIGATTVNEYTATIKKDSALDRRFERVVVREPSKFIMKEILPEIISHYEDFHDVTYSQNFVDNVVYFCEQFIPNRAYPDKAVTVIDHCGAQSKVSFWETDEKVKETKQEILDMVDRGEEAPEKLLKELNKRLQDWEDRIEDKHPVVQLAHLKSFFEKMKNPLSSIKATEESFKYLNKEFVGQKKAISGFKESLLRVSMGLAKKATQSTPDAYLFYGEKSTGKTLLAKTLKDSLEKSAVSVIYYSGIQLMDQMAQYKIVSDAQKNISLCEKVILNPNSVIIIDDFDEINYSCIDLFAQILKEGKIQLANGDVADFSNCKFIFTSSTKENAKSMGFHSDESSKIPSLNHNISALMEDTFQLLQPSDRDLRRILYKKLKHIKENLHYQDFDLKFDFEFIKAFVNAKKCEEKCIEEINQSIEKKIIPKVVSAIAAGKKSYKFNKKSLTNQ
ncbi:AAA family ATPase [bacterium]|nr:AAA family ATPase [bacterium]